MKSSKRIYSDNKYIYIYVIPIKLEGWNNTDECLLFELSLHYKSGRFVKYLTNGIKNNSSYFWSFFTFFHVYNSIEGILSTFIE